jgi:hypothetical protein
MTLIALFRERALSHSMLKARSMRDAGMVSLKFVFFGTDPADAPAQAMMNFLVMIFLCMTGQVITILQGSIRPLMRSKGLSISHTSRTLLCTSLYHIYQTMLQLFHFPLGEPNDEHESAKLFPKSIRVTNEKVSIMHYNKSFEFTKLTHLFSAASHVEDAMRMVY